MKEIGSKKISFDTIRKKWDENKEKWYFSIVDIVDMTGQSSNPRTYWKVLKNRLNKKQNKLVTTCNQLKLKASDGKFYLTDVGDIDTVIEILKIISPSKLLHFKAWALGLGKPKIEKIAFHAKLKMTSEMTIKTKEKSYPQMTYKLSDLLNKNSENLVQKDIEKNTQKKFKKVSKMGTI